ncbi:pyridoxamine phosphate oxidase family protein [Cordyceps fumosorosea ARSEF 2679]|uniref:Pyridoxamine phosphate oxidase family protein n=1 Tax=Cordyceps fumosorosea (strain ARSEF 2679) TaxID=1081104 RepID=A0A168BNT0_CORFA|nr:pyridoxamine phosphate oxidase family protein [Cordyceps fumosorosea ARSEF 2679]OAA70355.1 pyridoxamine phosphate oxidase family protein [Cordyceps fumosorosea ARSEF 2679]
MKLYDTLSDDLADWVRQQPVFFTGSASTHGPHVNVSPKGLTDSHFAVLSPTRCAYIDRMGSGCETIAHSYENGRLCLMFMSFGPTPRILRIFCRSSVVEWDSPRFPDLVRAVSRGSKNAFDGARAVIVCDVWQVQTSCGYGVPRVKKGIYAADDGSKEDDEADRASQKPGGGGDATVDMEKLLREGRDEGQKLTELCVFEQRPHLDYWSGIMVSRNTAHKYQAQNNSSSMDGLPGLKAARRDNKEVLWLGDAAAYLRRTSAEKVSVIIGFLLGVSFYFILAVLNLVPH